MDLANPLSETASDAGGASTPSLLGLFATFLLVGGISFGGGVVAYLREYLVTRRKWMDDEEFLEALEISQTLPGLNSVNLSVIAGDKMRGLAGAALAVAGMLLPGAALVSVLAVVYTAEHHNPHIQKFLTGVAAAAVGLLFTVTLEIGHKEFLHLRDVVLLLGTFAAVSLLHIPLYWVLVIIPPIAVWVYHPRKERVRQKPPRTIHVSKARR